MGKRSELIPAGKRFNGTLYRLGLATPYKQEANNYVKDWKAGKIRTPFRSYGLARVVVGRKNYEGKTLYYVYVR